MTTQNDYVPILSFLLIFIDIYILVSLRQLHKDPSTCQCALTKYSEQLILVSSITIVSRILKLIYRDTLFKTVKNTNSYILILLILDFCLSIYYIYLLVKYSLHLRRSQCNCVGPVGDVLYYYSNTIIFVTILMVLLILMIPLLQKNYSP